MSLLKLDLPQGVWRNGTKYQAVNRWYDANLVRFLENTKRPVGGWEQLSFVGGTLFAAPFTAGNGTQIGSYTVGTVGFGPCNSLVIESNKLEGNGSGGTVGRSRTDTDIAHDLCDIYMEITRPVSTAVNNYYASFIFRSDNSGSTNCSTPNDEWFQCRLRIPTGGGAGTIVELSLHRWDAAAIQESSGTPGQGFNNNFTLAHGNTIRLGVTLAGGNLTLWTEPEGGGTRTSHGAWVPSVNYNNTAHARVGVQIQNSTVVNERWRVDNLTVQRVVALAGVTRKLLSWRENLNNAPRLAAGTNTNIYAFTQGTLQDISPAALTTGAVDTVTAVGPYGSGAYGAFNYGEGNPAQGSLVECASWQLDTFGDFLVGVLLTDGRCLYWDGNTNTMTVMTEAPTSCKAIVVTPERFIMALGASGNPRLVKWATQEGGISGAGEWTPTSTNSAGDFILPGAGSIMCGRRGRNETLIFTDEDLFAAQYIGGTLIYSFKQLGSKCGIISRHAVAIVDGKAVWMGQRGFFRYDGFVGSVDCEVSDYLFSDFNRTQRHKCFALPLGNFGEVWFFYPSGSSAEPNRYVIWNYRENHWSIGDLVRTAGIDRGAFEYPMMVDLTTIYDHERGSSKAGAGTPSLESGPIELGNGDRTLMVRQIVPDEATQAGQSLGSVRAFLYSAIYPTGTETEHGPFTLANPTSARITARQTRIKLEEVTPGDWRVGSVRLDAEPGSER